MKGYKMSSNKTWCVAIALSLGAAACTKSIDSGKVEKSITEGLAQKGLTAKVSCPSGQAAKADAVFTCDATDDAGGKLAITVTQQDDNGTVLWKLDGQILDTSMVVADARGKLPGAEITCARKAVVVKASDTYTCAIARAAQRKLVIKVDNGNVAWEATN
jgi:Domain of unknown function (DUF4333)